MDYEKKYNNAMDAMRQWIAPCHTQEQLNVLKTSVFPELKESEDERIRKWCISHFRECFRVTKDNVAYQEYLNNKVIPWLEKQGNKDSQIILPTFTFDDIIALQCCMETVKKVQEDKDLYEKLNDLHGRVYDAYQLEKQGKQKSIWHNEDEEPKRGSLILLIMQSGTPIVAQIIEPNHTFNHGERWAYIDDLLEKQDSQILVNSCKTCKGEPKFKVKYAGSEYNVYEIKDLAGITFYGIEDEPNHIDYVKAENCEIISGYAIKENGSTYPNKPAVFSEQKSTDKVKPDFKDGDWVVYKGDICQIVKREEGCNKLVTNFGIKKELVNERNLSTARLWTIEDVKDGDVLYCKSGGIEYIVMSKGVNEFGNIDSYFRYNSLNGFGVAIPAVLSISQDDITPATKEQCDFLFQKMKEAGYEWNSDEKKLVKIPVLSNSSNSGKNTWSEEDNNMFYSALWYIKNSCDNGDRNSAEFEVYNWFKSLKDRVQPQPKQEWSDEDETALCDALWCCKQAASIAKDENDMGNAWYAEHWLNSLKGRVQPKVELTQLDKNILEAAIAFVEQNNHFNCWGGVDKKTVLSALRSLKPQTTWKPTEEQMEALDDFIYAKYPDTEKHGAAVKSLYQDLNKLLKED